MGFVKRAILLRKIEGCQVENRVKIDKDAGKQIASPVSTPILDSVMMI